MAYNDEAVTAKLNSLNESQDSIVTVAQWIMFHRRHADRTASLWLQRLQDTQNLGKRLNLIYLANEVVQQSRARSKADFLLAFEPLIADATALTYKGASSEVQGKLKRVVEVWRQRNIFDLRIQEQTEQRIVELDKLKGNGKGGGGRLGGSLFGGGDGAGVPSEMNGISKSLAALNKAESAVRPAKKIAEEEYAHLVDPETPIPTPPMHAAKLSAVMRNLAEVQRAIDASLKARRELLSGLESLIESNRARLMEDEATLTELAARWESVDAKKKDVEDAIMRGASAASTPAHINGVDGQEIAPPEAEGFTPPPPDVEAMTPPAVNEQIPASGDLAPFLGEDVPNEGLTTTIGAEAIYEQQPNFNGPVSALEPPPAFSFQTSAASAASAADDFLNSLNVLPTSLPISPDGITNGDLGNPRVKRQKTNHSKGVHSNEDDILGVADIGGIDEEGVSAMLGP